MEVLEAIAKRRAVRDFAPKRIAIGVVRSIIDAGLRAPTNNHLRQWEFVLVQDEEQRRRAIAKISQSMDAQSTTELIDSCA